MAAGIASQRILGASADYNESLMKKGFTALKNGTWEEYKETVKYKMRTSEWAFDRIKEAFDLVAKNEVENMSIVQEIMFKSTDYLRRITAPVRGQGGVTMSYLCPHYNSFLWKIMFGGSLLERSIPSGGVRFVEKGTTRDNQTGLFGRANRRKR